MNSSVVILGVISLVAEVMGVFDKHLLESLHRNCVTYLEIDFRIVM